MPQIQTLSPHVADLIAAGEVVERPASVAKELLENAIDAGATAVTVEMQNGGLTYLRVSDDGCGIAAEELPTAFLRHATSKMRRAEDLAAIGTLGFRGEALAAISSVARVDIFSRTSGAPSGASLHLEGGVPEAVQPAGCPEGTSIIVRDLFYNTPARLKFMKRDSAEASAISGLVAHLSLSHPTVSFKLIKDGEQILHTPGDGVLKSAIYAALGREFALGLIELHGADEALRVDGQITAPLNGRGTRGMQTFFVNGRLVKSQLLTAALEEAYANRSMKGKFPGCVLNVTLPFDTVDVNVHPAKTVVKFLHEKQVFDLVYHAACDALDRAGKPPEKPVPKPQETPFFRTMTAEQYRTSAKEKKSDVPAPFHTKIPAAASELSGRLTAADIVRSAPPAPVKSAPAPAKASVTPPEVAEEKAPAPQEPVAEQTTILPEKPAPWRFAGEVLNTYIVCEDGEKNVWLIDKHAAHERINFDRYQAMAEPLMSQPLLTPQVLTLPPEEYSALHAHLPLLQEFGFVCEEFGDRSILLREVPADLNASDAPAALEELAEKLAVAHGGRPASARDALLHTMACKAAIKGGWTSDERELRVLIDKVQNGEVQFCPHGRPVAVKLTKYELEKMFKRA